MANTRTSSHCGIYRGFVATAATLLLAATSPAAHAGVFFSGWFYSTAVGPLAGERALIAAGILYDNVPGTAGAPTYDYIYMVANTGTVPIAQFGGGTGPAGGAVLYNSDTSFGLPGLIASGPVNAFGPLPAFLTQVPPAGIPSLRGLPGGYGGANNPFLGSAAVTPFTPLFPGAAGLISPNYKYWGFEVTSTGVGYLLGWYNLVGNQLFLPGLVTRFDLDSTFGPVAGGAFIDPPPASTYLLDWINGDSVLFETPAIPDPSVIFCNPATDPQCSADIIPAEIAALNYEGYGVPEPGSLSLLGIAILVLSGIAYRRRRSVSRMASPR